MRTIGSFGIEMPNFSRPPERGIVAQYDGDCPYCDEPIEADSDRITEAESWGWVHVDCADEIAARRIRRGGTRPVDLI